MNYAYTHTHTHGVRKEKKKKERPATHAVSNMHLIYVYIRQGSHFWLMISKTTPLRRW